MSGKYNGRRSLWSHEEPTITYPLTVKVTCQTTTKNIEDVAIRFSMLHLLKLRDEIARVISGQEELLGRSLDQLTRPELERLPTLVRERRNHNDC